MVVRFRSNCGQDYSYATKYETLVEFGPQSYYNSSVIWPRNDDHCLLKKLFRSNCGLNSQDKVSCCYNFKYFHLFLVKLILYYWIVHVYYSMYWSQIWLEFIWNRHLCSNLNSAALFKGGRRQGSPLHWLLHLGWLGAPACLQIAFVWAAALAIGFADFYQLGLLSSY